MTELELLKDRVEVLSRAVDEVGRVLKEILDRLDEMEGEE